MKLKTITIFILSSVAFLLLFIFVIKSNIKQQPKIHKSSEFTMSWYDDNINGIKFKYPTELKIQDGFGLVGVSFWSLIKSEHKCSAKSDCLDGGLNFAFDYKVEDNSDLEGAYKRSIFYKDDVKNLVDKTIISVAGERALLAQFCDEWKMGTDCDGGKRSVRDIFILHNNKLYIFRFGGVGGSFEKDVLDSIVFAK